MPYPVELHAPNLLLCSVNWFLPGPCVDTIPSRVAGNGGSPPTLNPISEHSVLKFGGNQFTAACVRESVQSETDMFRILF
jgi:hypothetical protein